MIIHYTANAEQKFFLLQRHGRQIFKEEVTGIIKYPSEIKKYKSYYRVYGHSRTGEARWSVLYKKIDNVINVLTFYPLDKE